MILRLFLLLIIVPVVELYVLIKIGQAIGPLPTVGFILVSALVGSWLAKHQGFAVLRGIQDELAAGRLPAAQLLDGAMVLAGGVLLVLPGFLTDFIGLFLLVPVTRALCKRLLGLWLQKRLAKGQFVVVRRF